MNKAVFFDRDGIIIKTKKLNNKPVAISKINELELIHGVKKLIKIVKKNYFIFIITNQPDVERKKISKKNVDKINNFLKQYFKFDEVFTCYCSNNNCSFRKPNNGMIIKAKKKYNLDLKNSFLIGDRWKDIHAGIISNCKTIYVDYDYDEIKPKKPNKVVRNIKDIIKFFE